MNDAFKKSLPRRQWLRQTSQWLGGGLCMQMGGVELFLTEPNALAQGAVGSRKFIQIFLLGGWDSALAGDPVIPGGGKFAATTYDSRYKLASHGEYLGAPQQVPGKSNLWVGPGLTPALQTLSQVPMALINGIKVEVTAHELAMNYIYTGQMSLSRSREYPSLVATMANHMGGFPAHIVLGQGVPLAETAVNNPPLQTVDTSLLGSMLAGPYSNNALKEKTIDRAHQLIQTLNRNFEDKQSLAGKASLNSWKAGEGQLQELYRQRFDQKLGLTDALHAQFATGGKTDSPGAKLAVGALALESKLTKIVTVNFGGFDTHSNHHSMHLPLMQNFAKSLQGLLDYLMGHQDPDQPQKKLIETTTILITSEFVRTPQFNGAGGTDHWQSGSAILLGAGVGDHMVFGSTNDHGEPQPFQSQSLLPEHLIASILRSFGYSEDAKLISEVNLNGLLA